MEYTSSRKCHGHNMLYSSANLYDKDMFTASLQLEPYCPLPICRIGELTSSTKAKKVAFCRSLFRVFSVSQAHLRQYHVVPCIVMHIISRIWIGNSPPPPSTRSVYRALNTHLLLGLSIRSERKWVCLLLHKDKCQSCHQLQENN